MNWIFGALAFVVMGSSVAQAATMKEVHLWRGFSSQEQAEHLRACRSQIRTDFQVCSTNIYEHRHAAYDVCLMEADPAPTTVTFCYQGTTQREQDRSLADCRRQIRFGQFCVANLWVHQHAAYDVCIME